MQNLLADADEKVEVDVLTYHVHGLSRTVLRKHRLINAGWLLNAGTLLSLIAAGATLLLRH